MGRKRWSPKKTRPNPVVPPDTLAQIRARLGVQLGEWIRAHPRQSARALAAFLAREHSIEVDEKAIEAIRRRVLRRPTRADRKRAAARRDELPRRARFDVEPTPFSIDHIVPGGLPGMGKRH